MAEEVIMTYPHLYFPLYTKHIGQPLYYFARKYMCESKLAGIECAVLPSSIVLGAASGAFTGSIYTGLASFFLHQLVFPFAVLDFHRLCAKQRQELSLEKIVKTH